MAPKKWTFVCPDDGEKTPMGILDDQSPNASQTFCGKPGCGRGQIFYPVTAATMGDKKFLIEEVPPKKKPEVKKT